MMFPTPSQTNSGDESQDRNKVKEALRLFNNVHTKLSKEKESCKKKQEPNKKDRLDYQAAKILKEEDAYVNTGKQIIGKVPGVEIGDEFQFFVELNIVGLHRPSQSGIDYVKLGKTIVATSIVASGGYDDDMGNSNVLSYMGQGGNVMQKEKNPEDQKLERGNLALANSKVEQNDVRVIRGEAVKGRKRYVYDGLYRVHDYKQELGPRGMLVYKFELVRKPGQPGLAPRQQYGQSGKSAGRTGLPVRLNSARFRISCSNRYMKVYQRRKMKPRVREGVCVADISLGKELKPICAINTIDDEKPPPFEYVTSMVYPNWCSPLLLKDTCDCTKGCSDLRKCSCVKKNGGEIPYNDKGALVEAKPLVYECGPACKCPSSCQNRVSQHGIKLPLEVFRTETRGWGVRSRETIPSGSFICEYVGELLEEKEAEKRTDRDEYLFDIGNDDEGDSSMPDVSGFAIDAAEKGNVGRFINHSCSPNLYAQDVLYDHEDRRTPHVMLFATEDIPPLQELTYDYNYKIDHVLDASGNVKKKACLCGSSECTGWLY